MRISNSIQLSDKVECAPLDLTFLYLALFDSSILTTILISEALSCSSHGSQGSLDPEDSVSQVFPQYFTDNLRLRYLKLGAVGLGQGTGAGSGCSELGSNMSAQLD